MDKIIILFSLILQNISIIMCILSFIIIEDMPLLIVGS